MATIYCVEDDSGIQELILCAIQSGGYTHVRYYNWADIFEKLQVQTPDLILMDIKYDGVKFVYDDYACERFKRNLVDSLGDLQRKYAIRESMIKSLDDLNG